ncbi:nucleoside triphosphate pyrophosphohydrolase [Amphritea pacifica]|uniref:Nucleoside triphosphate pyrophosphohydrolase n=1 Tax=Amphritea pacifica TaxID=2811233 RepID=A0ABS2WBW7_9GAMM|nr:nucleoside triphosphate pyrophosphohydrolase [Amphritea pacifica]MBN0988837.1 nucleoside triphosphate pyrophosphohydrolase [Amphritea pacifica]MBN1006299.1 nucleoside triphosphate pyrophosphohydrolase [Amphritea pacifica]
MRYTLDDLQTLMARLRDPEDGCPWDLKQDFASIVPHTLEEAYEVADTIERQDWQHLQGELGDLLFQVIFYARLAEEQQGYNFDDIVDTLVKKLIRRHPHVFPEGTLTSRRSSTALDEQQIKETWEVIKAEERGEKPFQEPRVLDDIPMALPALNRAEKLQKRAARVGFDWGDVLPVLDKIEEEIAELREAIAAGDQLEMEHELGDLLFAQVNLARHMGVNPETALRYTNQKFTNRFNYIEDQVERSSGDWQAFTLDELDHWWNEAKRKGL